jgi:hypothetical protein
MKTSAASLETNTSGQFASWMLKQPSSFDFKTYQVGKFFLLLLQLSRQFAVFDEMLIHTFQIGRETENCAFPFKNADQRLVRLFRNHSDGTC